MLIKPARRDLTIRSIGIEDELLGKSFSLACIKLGIKPAKINAIKTAILKESQYLTKPLLSELRYTMRKIPPNIDKKIIYFIIFVIFILKRI